MKEPFAPPGGWARFASEHWARSPAHYRRSFDGSFLDLERVQRITRLGVRDLERHILTRLRVFLDGGRQEQPLRWLPRRSDRDLEDYARRLRNERAGDLTVVLNGASAYDLTLHRRACAFLRGLGAHAPLSISHDLVLYMSDARRTSFGIHRDEENNFIFMVHGKKRFRVWPKGFIEARPGRAGATEYADIVNDALTFDLEPGDLLYIPTGLHHVAESARGLCVHAGLLVHDSSAEVIELVANVAAKLVKKQLTGVTSRLPLEELVAQTSSGKPRLPGSIANVLDAYASLGPSLRDAVTELWALRGSSFGFLDGPPMRRNTKLADGDRLALVPSSGLVVYRAGASVVVAANGHVYRFPAHARLERVAHGIRSGRQATVAQWIAEGRGIAKVAGEDVMATPAFVRMLLSTLFRMRAVDVVP